MLFINIKDKNIEYIELKKLSSVKVLDYDKMNYSTLSEQELNNFLANKKLKNKYISVVITTSDIILKNETIPKLKNIRQIRSYIENNNIDSLNIDKDEYYYDFKIHQETKEDIKITLVAVKKDKIDTLVRIVQMQDAKIENIFIYNFCLQNFFLNKKSEESCAVIDIMEDEMNITLLESDKNIFFVKSLDLENATEKVSDILEFYRREHKGDMPDKIYAINKYIHNENILIELKKVYPQINEYIGMPFDVSLKTELHDKDYTEDLFLEIFGSLIYTKGKGVNLAANLGFNQYEHKIINCAFLTMLLLTLIISGYNTIKYSNLKNSIEHYKILNYSLKQEKLKYAEAQKIYNSMKKNQEQIENRKKNSEILKKQEFDYNEPLDKVTSILPPEFRIKGFGEDKDKITLVFSCENVGADKINLFIDSINKLNYFKPIDISYLNLSKIYNEYTLMLEKQGGESVVTSTTK